jgi:hypothetical protein
MRLRLPKFDRTTVAVTTGVVLFALAYVGIAAYVSSFYEASSPTPSVFSRSNQGFSVWYGYLSRLGLDPKTLTQFDALPSNATLVVAAPFQASPTPAESKRLAAWVKGGGRLVLVSTEMLGLADGVGPAPKPASASATSNVEPSMPGVLASGVDAIAAGVGRFEDAGPEWVAAYSDDAGDVILSKALGSGSVVWLADSTAVSNAGIGNADDAKLAVLLAFSPGRSIYFDEFHHGYVDSATPWDRLPSGGRAAVVLVLLGVGVLLLARGRRVGPPIALLEKKSARGSAYIAQLAALYRKAGARAEALESLEDGLGRALGRRFGTRALGMARQAGAREALEASAALRVRGHIRPDEFLAAARRLRRARHEVEGN